MLQTYLRMNNMYDSKMQKGEKRENTGVFSIPFDHCSMIQKNNTCAFYCAHTHHARCYLLSVHCFSNYVDVFILFDIDAAERMNLLKLIGISIRFLVGWRTNATALFTVAFNPWVGVILLWQIRGSLSFNYIFTITFDLFLLLQLFHSISHRIGRFAHAGIKLNRLIITSDSLYCNRNN